MINKRYDHRWAPLTEEERQGKSRICVFISYHTGDKRMAETVAMLLSTLGINFYLDTHDGNLEISPSRSSDAAIVKAMERGLNRSSHLLSIISDQTRGSWWVPWESGGAHGRQMECALLLLDDVKELPSYLQVIPHLQVQSDLWGWLSKLAGDYRLLAEKRHRIDAIIRANLPAERVKIRYVTDAGGSRRQLSGK